jgi:hypothetical protein
MASLLVDGSYITYVGPMRGLVSNPGLVRANANGTFSILWSCGSTSHSVSEPNPDEFVAAEAPEASVVSAAPEIHPTIPLAESNALTAQAKTCRHWTPCATGCGGNHCAIGKYKGRPAFIQCMECIKTDAGFVPRDILERSLLSLPAPEKTAMAILDLLAKVQSDLAALNTAQTNLLALQAQIATVTNTITTDQSSTEADTAAFADDLHTNGPILVQNADGTYTTYTWDGSTGFHPVTFPVTRVLQAPPPELSPQT